MTQDRYYIVASELLHNGIPDCLTYVGEVFLTKANSYEVSVGFAVDGTDFSNNDVHPSDYIPLSIEGTNSYTVEYDEPVSLDTIKSALVVSDNYDDGLSLQLIQDNYTDMKEKLVLTLLHLK